ncbi:MULTISPECIES: hypothetical protein [Photorhabdus]|uniref:Uncharacterized protein n=2 Tax=Photorhabdus asymbiotica TaxID=291112 RepID=C7BMW2_PHOAA|nr:hypothetical protein [Photorhabdus asymbiotica]RKS57734.1 hypothetical protein BDD30_2546 [Photorhabdus asymbiotica]CAQ82948.1 Hypothetical protein PAU_00856 [Photorhabdus asymbiotica]
MKFLSCALLLGLAYIPFSFAEISVNDVNNEINAEEKGALSKCTDLLPKGHVYTISIVGKSDKKTANADGKFKGKFSVSDETKKPLDKKRSEEIKPFIQCVTDTAL